ncbi:MAG: DUF4011 domain-containing protein [Firmicutes bacterium]|nr:DUF4011 domain-containing protein [Bacillota bacterium]MCL1954040.1 DUF4011 domain-containing protein [Bacillota bacterium]
MSKIFDLWCQKLLDTSKRNAFINFKDAKLRKLDVLAPSFSLIFEDLYMGKSLQIFNVDEYLGGTTDNSKRKIYFEVDDNFENYTNQQQSTNDNDMLLSANTTSDIVAYENGNPIYSSQVGSNLNNNNFDYENNFSNTNTNTFEKSSKNTIHIDKVSAKLAKLYDKLSKGEILAHKRDVSTNHVLKSMQKLARECLIEKGVNILYITFGTLNWSVVANSRIDNLVSPIILMPIKLEVINKSKFVISYTQEDLNFNPALAYRLKHEHNIEFDKFNFDDKLDIDNYFQFVKEQIAHQSSWSVNSSCALGLFSFNKLDMYNDLVTNRNKVLAHNIIDQIVNPSSVSNLAQRNSIDFDLYFKQSKDIVELHSVVDADSSQIETIALAKDGKNLVVQGPPGTGKSQTITNIIAELLYQNKSVLFVSEKMAALNVVYDRLDKVGLSKFCLELHNADKIDKKKIIYSLTENLDLTYRLNNDFFENTKIIFRDKQKLDEYLNALHENIAQINQSPYEILSNISKYSNVKQLDFIIPKISEKNDQYILRAKTIIENHCQYCSAIGQDFRQHIWYGLIVENVDFVFLNEFKSKLKLANQYYSDIIDFKNTISNVYSLDIFDSQIDPTMQSLKVATELSVFDGRFFERESLSKLFNATTQVKETLDQHAVFIDKLDIACNQLFNTIVDIASNIQQYLDNLYSQIMSVFNEQLFDKDIDILYHKYTTQYKGAISRIFGGKYKQDAKLLSTLSKNNIKINYKLAVEKLQIAKQYMIVKTKLNEFNNRLSNLNKSSVEDTILLFDMLEKVCSDINQFQEKYRDSIHLRQRVEIARQELEKVKIDLDNVKLHATGIGLNKVDDWHELYIHLDVLNDILPCNFRYFARLNQFEFDNIKSRLAQYVSQYDSISKNGAVLQDLQHNFDKSIIDFDIIDFQKGFGYTQRLLDEYDSIQEFVRFEHNLREIKQLELYDWLIFAISNGVRSDELNSVFLKSFYLQQFYWVLSINPILNHFSRQTHDKIVQSFVKHDQLSLVLARTEVSNNIIKNIRHVLENDKSSLLVAQIKLLRHEAGKKMRHIPVRKLMSNAIDLVQTLKPCFLMSPNSVATYLNDTQFDVVIFDEASQIFPWDSLGSIYRAKQVVVVGDSKQMPPSNFFETVLGSDDEQYDDTQQESEDDPIAFESILDKCVTLKGTSFYEKTLKWHYRSRSESLIAFSNKHFYQNQLVTFNSPQDGVDTGVEFEFVQDGIYDNNQNRDEANRVVQLIYQHYATHPERSLGIIAFSVKQQQCIEYALEYKRSKDDRFAKYFDEQLVEPFFVKNLENVQGDERDTIIFSVGYANNSIGKFRQSFGPLSIKGGERRLNVAITRAKHNVKLVSSIRAHDIDANRAKSVGARLLKEYLEYAERGVKQLYENLDVKDINKFDSKFELEVYQVLVDNGYKVNTQVGSSGFRIDLAVKHPTLDCFILAIECDGAIYHSSKNARDRDRLRQSILENMGWKFYRIWSTDWFKNNKVEKRVLLEYVQHAIADFKLIEKSNKNTFRKDTIAKLDTIEPYIVENTQINKQVVGSNSIAKVDTRDVYSSLNTSNNKEVVNNINKPNTVDFYNNSAIGGDVLIDNLFVSIDNYIVKVSGKRVLMSPKEIELLYYFVTHPMQVFSREKLLESVWKSDYNGDSRTVDVHIKRIREKIGEGENWRFVTVWGRGYKFEIDTNIQKSINLLSCTNKDTLNNNRIENNNIVAYENGNLVYSSQVGFNLDNNFVNSSIDTSSHDENPIQKETKETFSSIDSSTDTNISKSSNSVDIDLPESDNPLDWL